MSSVRYTSYSNSSDNTVIWGFSMIMLIMILGIFSGPIFGTDPEGARRVLEAQGYTKVEITGYRWFMGREDFYKTGFKAISPNGTPVSGAVTRGLIFKSATVRLD